MGVTAGTAAAIGTAVSIIGTGVSMYGASQQADAQQKAANYQAQVARNNAQVASQNAQAVQDQAAVKAKQDLRVSTMRASAQRAALGASGVALDSGSAMDVTAATAGAGMQTAQNDTYQGQLSARSYLAQASNYDATAGLDTIAGQNAGSAGQIAMASSFLGGASQVSSKWSSWQNATNPPTANVNTPASTSNPNIRVGDLY